MLNCYEESNINNEALPDSWRSERILNELEEFLQANWEQRSVFFEDEVLKTKQQFLCFTAHGAIRTKRYIGTISFANEQLNIFPKVFRKNMNDSEISNLTQSHLMMNLVKWLEYCNRVSYPFINISTAFDDASNLKDFFITLYLGYIRSAMERGAYYQYVEETEDVSFLKGKLDYKNYVLQKIPNGMSNKFRCSFSTFEFDNPLNRIIKCVCKQLLNSSTHKNYVKAKNILVRLNEVSDVKCLPSDCDNIHLSSMNSNYRVILSMSKMFLLNSTSNYSIDSNESFCFLFPTDLLFEGFIGGFIQETLEDSEGKVFLQKSDMSLVDDIRFAGKTLGNAFTMRHDILIEQENRILILDTKYKAISRFESEEQVIDVVEKEIKQSDIYQVCEYARKRGASDVFLLYPMFRYEEPEPYYPIGISNGKYNVNIHFVRVPFVFEENESFLKDQLTSLLKRVMGISR